MTKETKDWYSSWFDTPFYHILYKHRDDKEAQAFMDNLTSYLNIPQGSSILDLACGKGRHAVYLNSIGYDVTGIDLSEKSIAFAKQFENETLHFEVHDMREAYPKQFNAVFNLFTSFGFFDDDKDDLKTITSIKANLKEHGIGVIDFLNADFVIHNLVKENTKTINGIDFRLKRYVENGFIVKDISFEANEKPYHYQELVKVLTLKDFENMFAKANIQLLDVFGDYKLNKFNKHNSERLIMIFM
ncbi:SAM-dependent methyltransferase [Pontimicrobium aquaticum]|uniref:Class I SAM-dependent methyltransferase n=1 Tax=Pontimicrobium aquaticum TaxID=2565367 RepID=A0A4U0ER03_9FLAO|nr:class I SAM-dependent methyltransferase [Pontimicrobium aquaticum]TJY34070.1 class I SAM-dependent methyltransferase [Pontimicrobium aquaticum]